MGFSWRNIIIITTITIITTGGHGGVTITTTIIIITTTITDARSMTNAHAGVGHFDGSVALSRALAARSMKR